LAEFGNVGGHAVSYREVGGPASAPTGTV
jgi:hypothetical protein